MPLQFDGMQTIFKSTQRRDHASSRVTRWVPCQWYAKDGIWGVGGGYWDSRNTRRGYQELYVSVVMNVLWTLNHGAGMSWLTFFKCCTWRSTVAILVCKSKSLRSCVTSSSVASCLFSMCCNCGTRMSVTHFCACDPSPNRSDMINFSIVS